MSSSSARARPITENRSAWRVVAVPRAAVARTARGHTVRGATRLRGRHEVLLVVRGRAQVKGRTAPPLEARATSGGVQLINIPRC